LYLPSMYRPWQGTTTSAWITADVSWTRVSYVPVTVIQNALITFGDNGATAFQQTPATSAYGLISMPDCSAHSGWMSLALSASGGAGVADAYRDPSGNADVAAGPGQDASANTLAVSSTGCATANVAVGGNCANGDLIGVAGTGETIASEGVAVSGTGTGYAGTAAVSGAGDTYAGTAAVSGTQEAAAPHVAIGGAGAYGGCWHTGGPSLAVSPTGEAAGACDNPIGAGVSGMGCAWDETAVSATCTNGERNEVNATGDASGDQAAVSPACPFSNNSPCPFA
jgi:hypothetical protein